MRKDDLLEFAKTLGIENISANEEWVRGSCPFAAIAHSKGKDSRPSFGMAINNTGHSRFYCLACGKAGKALLLPTLLGFVDGVDYKKSRGFWTKECSETVSDGGFEIDYAPAIAESVLLSFRPVPAEVAAQSRIGVGLIAERGLRYDGTENRLIFPIRDVSGRLVGLRGRSLGSDVQGMVVRFKSYANLSPSRKDAKVFGVWFGEERMRLGLDPITVVEGERDQILLEASGFGTNVIASMGAAITKLQIKRLFEHAGKRAIILFFDNDAAGIEATNKVISYRREHPFFRIADYRGCKDPAEIVEKGEIVSAWRSLTKV